MKPRSPAARSARLVAAVLILTATREALAGSWTGHAVLVGVADYEGPINDLLYPDDDAQDVRDTLLLDTEHWSESNVETILNSYATFDEIRAAIERMRAATAATDDVCVFFFSGHGDYWLDVPPYDEADGYDEVLVAYDWDIYDDDLAAWLSGFTTQHVCVIIDTCYAGGIARSSGGFSAADWVAGMAEDIARIRPLAAKKSPADRTSWRGGPPPAPGTKDLDDLGAVNVVALTACRDVELAEEDLILQNGVFTFYVVEAMRHLDTDTNGDTLSSAEEIFAWAAPRASLWNPTQTPVLYDADEGLLNQLPVIGAADRYVEPILTEGDLPFGGGIKGGCLPARASRTQTSAASDSAALGWLAALGVALGVIASRRRASAALGLAVLGLVMLAPATAGCLYTYPSTSHAHAAAGHVPSQSGPARAGAVEAGEAPYSGAPAVLPGAQDTETGRLSVGIRAGALVPFGSRNAPYSETVQAGLFAAGKLWNVPFEIGLDVCRLESRSVDVTADVLSGRVDILAVRRPPFKSYESYYHFGPRILVDFVMSKSYWGGTSQVAAAVGAGVGLRRPGGGWDARLSVDGLVGSSNIAGFVKLDAGFRF